MNFPFPLSCKGLMSPRKQTRDLLHFWQAQRRDRRMFDKALIRGFYEPKLLHVRRYFHSLESLKTPKKTPGGSFFVQFSLLRPKKYKTYQRRTLLASKEEKTHLFSYLVRKVLKRLNYHLPNDPSKAAYSLSFTSVKEGKITWKDPFEYDK